MLQFYQFPFTRPKRNFSPFCFKLQTWLDYMGLPYENKMAFNPAAAPKGKIPYIKDGSTVMGDSHFIIEYLKGIHGIDPDESFSPVETAQAHMLRILAEDRLYWIVVYYRWIPEPTWPAFKAALFGKVPMLLRDVLALKARNDVRAMLHGQGLGRHKAEDIAQFARDDVAAIADFLGQKKYMMGDAFTSVDASVFAMLENGLWPFDTPLKREIESHPNLVAYIEHMTAGLAS